MVDVESKKSTDLSESSDTDLEDTAQIKAHTSLQDEFDFLRKDRRTNHKPWLGTNRVKGRGRGRKDEGGREANIAEGEKTTRSNNDNTVINLSEMTLEDDDIKNLTLGLSYCQSDGFDYEQSRIDLFMFTRKLKWSKIHSISKRKVSEPCAVSEQTTVGENIERKDNLLIEDLYLMRELWALEDETTELSSEDQLVARLEMEGIRLDEEGASGLKPKSRIVPAPSGDLIDQFSDIMIK
ncbi:hypothetical protein NDU88_005572 [Pleurodeles waltl]|uniref:Uncharacterized protein n=1 Tax=Pleurodeles waltl TaxID=8319 RepID=A0AAV7LPX6_PLEWA|nr:hypothetical protein NDU88_005572 [Pleurodeles waltl]